MDTISFRQGAHSIEVHVQAHGAIYVINFPSSDLVISFAAGNQLISGADADAFNTGKKKLSGWSKAIYADPESKLLKIGFRRV